ncbi:unnamed protein product [Linum trigynum]|uniref:Uncharacterized protein n=2 Tax=Linum trigynum TaxID=586398 RepID=A0AAV2DK22_9ROSI
MMKMAGDKESGHQRWDVEELELEITREFVSEWGILQSIRSRSRSQLCQSFQLRSKAIILGWHVDFHCRCFGLSQGPLVLIKQNNTLANETKSYNYTKREPK